MRLSLPALIATALVQLSTAYPFTAPSPTQEQTSLPAISPAPNPAFQPPCYTYTTSLHPKTCEPLRCIELMCITMSTTELPCPTASCPSTPTVTEWLPCRTTCRGGCATETMPVVSDICTVG